MLNQSCTGMLHKVLIIVKTLEVVIEGVAEDEIVGSILVSSFGELQMFGILKAAIEEVTEDEITDSTLVSLFDIKAVGTRVAYYER